MIEFAALVLIVFGPLVVLCWWVGGTEQRAAQRVEEARARREGRRARRV